ncbi:MAG TPA: glycosyltransferase family 2 protein [Chitinophagaceae bacterium]|nr:glycosyltransferase family 2 protein [Chitinophagaceae bacterium]
MIDNKSIFVIVPCFNEARVIRKTVTEVLEKGYSVVVVDDCSKDGSKKQITGLPVYYLRHRVNMGQGAALQTGIDFAKKKGAKYFVTFDADGQHDSNDIPGMVEFLEKEKVDIVFGSRFLPGSKTNVSRYRSFALNFGRYINFWVSGIMLSDSFNGFRLFSKPAAEKITLTENRMAHPAEFLMLTAANKLKYTEYPVAIHYSDYSKAKGLKNRDGIKILFEILLYKIFR